MLEYISLPQMKDLLLAISKRVIGERDRLNAADREIGDGDHGAAMARGFSAVITILEKDTYSDMTELFIAAGNAMIASVGGAAGIIFGTFFRSGGKALNGKKILDAAGLADFLAGAYQAVQDRGKAKLGDKTMLDALHPAVEAAKNNLPLRFPEFAHTVAQAAQDGLSHTGDLVAATGRAKDFGRSAVGCLDPGSITLYLIISSIDEFVNQ